MTTTEAAALLGLSPKTVRRQIENGAIKARKHGRDWHVTPAEVERYRRDSLGTRRPAAQDGPSPSETALEGPERP